MEDIALNLFTAILIGALSALITADLAFRRFRTEKWWERKVEAYTKVIESLHYLKAWTDAHYAPTGLKGFPFFACLFPNR